MPGENTATPGSHVRTVLNEKADIFIALGIRTGQIYDPHGASIISRGSIGNVPQEFFVMSTARENSVRQLAELYNVVIDVALSIANRVWFISENATTRFTTPIMRIEHTRRVLGD
jgi:hypothetical protein